MDQQFSLSLPTSELNLELCVSCGQVFRWSKAESGEWRGVDGESWFIARQDESGISVRSNAAQSAFTELFDLEVKLAEVERAILRRGPELRLYIASLPGLRRMRPSSPVEAMFSFLCTPNNHLQRILSMVRYLGSLGADIGEGFKRFPTLEQIAMLPEAHLRSAGFGYRAATIPAIAREVMVRGGETYLAGLAAADYRTTFQELASIKGIGPKLADCIALFALHKDLAVPVDTHLWQAATRLYFPEWRNSALTAQRYRAIGDHMRERFGELAGWAHQYLFYDNLLNWRSKERKNVPPVNLTSG